jgi:hypothetical protein
VLWNMIIVVDCWMDSCKLTEMAAAKESGESRYTTDGDCSLYISSDCPRYFQDILFS